MVKRKPRLTRKQRKLLLQGQIIEMAIESDLAEKRARAKARIWPHMPFDFGQTITGRISSSQPEIQRLARAPSQQLVYNEALGAANFAGLEARALAYAKEDAQATQEFYDYLNINI